MGHRLPAWVGAGSPDFASSAALGFACENHANADFGDDGGARMWNQNSFFCGAVVSLSLHLHSVRGCLVREHRGRWSKLIGNVRGDYPRNQTTIQETWVVIKNS